MLAQPSAKRGSRSARMARSVRDLRGDVMRLDRGVSEAATSASPALLQRPPAPHSQRTSTGEYLTRAVPSPERLPVQNTRPSRVTAQ